MSHPLAATVRVAFALRLPPTKPAVRPPAPPTDDRATVRPGASS